MKPRPWLTLDPRRLWLVGGLLALSVFLTALIPTGSAAGMPIDSQFSSSVFSGCASVASSSAQQDCSPLVALYESTNGGNWTNHDGWKATNTPCTWFGVTCESGRVKVLSLSSNNLSGSIPKAVGSLTFVSILDLSSNNLNGSVPKELKALSNLGSLILSNNQLSGSIPKELASATKLQTLDLRSNQLSGSIPTELGSLSKLQNLGLSSNQLTGAIPTQLGSLSNLTVLNLDANQLSGPVPSQLANLTKLQRLALAHNSLSGPLPVTLAKLQQVKYLSYDHTSVCELSYDPFQTWLSSITDLSKSGVICRRVDLPLFRIANR